MAWKSPAQTLQEWKEQRARERRSFDPLGAGPSRYDPLISMQDRVQPPGATPLIRGRPDSPFPPAGLPAQQSTQGIADVFGAPQEGPGYPFAGMFDQPSSMARPFKRQEAASDPAPLIAGPSISDRVRGNRYANMDPRERQALNLTIAGELAPSSYGTPAGDQEVANMVETITTRAAQKGKSIEDTVKQNRQYSPWNTLPSREAMRENFRAHAPDVRRMVSNAVTGDVMPTHEGLTSYHATRMPGTGRKPTWARGIEPSARAGRHSFYTDIAPWSSSPAGSPLPAAPVGPVASRDLPEPPPSAPFSRGAPLSAGAIAGTDLPPPADYTGPPPYTGRPVNAPLATPPALSGGFTPESGMPASPTERIATGLATPQIGDPALQQALGPRPPLVALAEDRATRERAPLIAPPAGVPQTPLRGPAPMPGVDMGQMPMPAGATPRAPVQSEIVAPPAGPLIDQTRALERPPLVAPAAAVPPGAPLVTPRREVTPQTPVLPEPESNLPPLPSTTVSDLPVATAPETATMSTPAPLIAPPATTQINPRLSPKEIEKRARDRGFGTVENLTGDRWARGIGAGAGVAAGLATGNPLAALALGVQGYRSGDDVRRSYMNRTGPFGILGNIFGRGSGSKKKSERDKLGTPPSSEPAGVKEAAAAASHSGLGSDRGYSGGTYGGGYGQGLRDLLEGVGGAYRNR